MGLFSGLPSVSTNAPGGVRLDQTTDLEVTRILPPYIPLDGIGAWKTMD